MLTNEQRTPYIEEVANRRGLRKGYIEKDFWVCFILRILFQTPKLKDILVFKGGTSLSKVFGVINRFSEDIDLSIDPTWLGFKGETHPEAAETKSQFHKRCKKLEEECCKRVEEYFQPHLESEIREVLCSLESKKQYFNFEIDPQSKSPILIFHYPTLDKVDIGNFRSQIKLEMGSLFDQKPVGEYTVSPWIAEEFPDIFTEPNAQVIALEAERTFWEKATILHAEYHRPKEKPMRFRLSRDCYDLCKMISHETGQRAIDNLGLLENVVQFKQRYFSSNWANYDTAKPGSIRLVPPIYRHSDLYTDYRNIQDMFTEEPPTFEELLGILKKIENRINDVE